MMNVHAYHWRRFAAASMLMLGLALLFAHADAQTMDAPEDTITLTSPNNVTIAEADDYATQILADPWDMNNLDDIDTPYHFSVPSLANGLWSSTTQAGDAMFQLQYQNLPTVYSYVGEHDGANLP